MEKGNSLEAYHADDRLRDLVDDNNLLLLVIDRFNIPLGFGDSTIAEICSNENLDTSTFLAVANLVCGRPYSARNISLPALTTYLENAHSYFLDFILPSIREKLIKAINSQDATDVGFLILKYYDDYLAEVNRHMKHENDVIFPHVNVMASGQDDDRVSLLDYSLNHDDMVDKLQELKDIIIRHYPHTTNNVLTYALYDIINVENDLTSHWRIENELFMPAGLALEQKMKELREQRPDDSENDADAADSTAKENEVISNREKEIIGLVAKGLSNKEIADRLFLSVHTVTTHRRNIASKLQIHSAAGLTIYAILHNIIDISEVSLD